MTQPSAPPSGAPPSYDAALGQRPPIATPSGFTAPVSLPTSFMLAKGEELVLRPMKSGLEDREFVANNLGAFHDIFIDAKVGKEK